MSVLQVGEEGWEQHKATLSPSCEIYYHCWIKGTYTNGCLPSLKSMKICKTALFWKMQTIFLVGNRVWQKAVFLLKKKPRMMDFRKICQTRGHAKSEFFFFFEKFGIKKWESGRRGKAGTESQFSVLSFFSLLFLPPPQEHRTKNDFWKQTSISFYQFFFSFFFSPHLHLFEARLQKLVSNII